MRNIFFVLLLFSPFGFSALNNSNSEDTKQETPFNNNRLEFVTSLFSGKEQFQNLNRVHTLFPKTTVLPSSNPLLFQLDEPKELPTKFIFEGKQVDVDEYLLRTDTAALLIIQRAIISEFRGKNHELC